MSDQCIFCLISSGALPSPVVYEDDQVMAFVDLHPHHPDHTLVVPKQHTNEFTEMDPAAFQHLMDVAYKVGKQVHTAFPTPRLSVFIKGFDVSHTHVHLIPLAANSDIISGKYGEHLPPQATTIEREAMADAIKHAAF